MDTIVHSDITESLQNLDDHYLFVDLEVDQTDTIFRCGILGRSVAIDASHTQLALAFQTLVAHKERHFGWCGHNFRRFDYPHLLTIAPDVRDWPIVDSLELSLLAFPLQRSHRLNKDYKLSDFASNNPLEDARATRLLLHTILQKLFTEPETLLHCYLWLLTCGQSDADAAYRHCFFDVLHIAPFPLPQVNTLPPNASAGFDLAMLHQFFAIAPQRSFDERLCVAALLAWNHASKTAGVAVAYSSWLMHLPAFAGILERLRPIQPAGFSFQPFLDVFGIPAFRSIQEDAIQAILQGTNPVLLMPTGGGKSLCYQMPALILAEHQLRLTVVISPLQALMEDQVADLEKAELRFATFINGNVIPKERAIRLEQVRAGVKHLLYISPEQLRSPSIRAVLKECPPTLWVIDEAHSVSQWGHDFRPDYTYIPKFITELSQQHHTALPRIVLLTATATQAVLTDVRQVFAQHGIPLGQTMMAASMHRPNLHYYVRAVSGDRRQTLLQAVQEVHEQDGCVLVYTTTRKDAESLANLLNEAGITSRYYHGKLARDEKRAVLQQFKQREVNVVVATCAFGMGINRADVRAVIHHTMSANLENYIQESGRAGRDGKPATCLLLFDPEDADTIFWLQGQNQLSEGDLTAIFEGMRHLRQKTFDKVSDAWFWATPEEILRFSAFEEEFARDDEQRDTKLKIALHFLEDFGLVERAENMTTVVHYHLCHSTMHAATAVFTAYARDKDIAQQRQASFLRLIVAMYQVQDDAVEGEEEAFPLDRLCDASGLDAKQVIRLLNELALAGICTFTVPLVLRLTKGRAGDARTQMQRLLEIEREMFTAIHTIMEEQALTRIHINMRGLANQLDPDGTQKINAALLMSLLEGWSARQWARIRRVGASSIELAEVQVADYYDAHAKLAPALIQSLYEALGTTTGARLRVTLSLHDLLTATNKHIAPLNFIDEEIEQELLWLHQRGVLRLAEGLHLLHQALKVRVLANANIGTIKRRYGELTTFYQQQIWRTHVMVQYGQLPDEPARLRLVDDYFRLSADEFRHNYPSLATEASLRPLLPEDEERILGPLNDHQRAIVTATDQALLVNAGPGSGKTRTIIHRVAYLIKTQRIDPARIIMLAYNRNAVRELRVRLRVLLGFAATHVRIVTFHSLALTILGRNLDKGKKQRHDNTQFEQILRDACIALEAVDEGDNANPYLQRLGLWLESIQWLHGKHIAGMLFIVFLNISSGRGKICMRL